MSATEYVLMIDGDAVPITHLFDEDGEPVERWEEAFTFVAGPLSNGHWYSDVTRDYDVHRVN